MSTRTYHKWTTEEVRDILAQEGYALLTDYVRMKDKITALCNSENGRHKWVFSWRSWLEGKRCKQCYDERRIPTFDFISKEFENKGLIPLFDEYKNAKQKLSYQCKECGFKHQISWNKFKGGHGCPRCATKLSAQKRALDYQVVVEAFEAMPLTLLSTSYQNAYIKLKYKCEECGLEHQASWNKLKDGHGCPRCEREQANDKRRIPTQTIIDSVTTAGYKVVNIQQVKVRKGPRDKFILECDASSPHQFETCWNHWQRGHRCPDCNPKRSKAEKEIAETYKNIGLNLIENDRAILNGKELDLYFPNHRVAIEYCGLYWHSDAAPGDRITSSYHKQKLIQCQANDIRLLTIFEDEWLSNKEICLSRIDNALGITQNRIYARQCKVKRITKDKAKGFLNRTHLQGSSGCKVAYGLFYGDKLVQVMTFGSPARAHTAKKKKVLELKRLATQLDTIVIGGSSKLFKQGLKYTKDNGYDLVKSYCDLRWGTGNLYKKLGFTKTSNGAPARHYTDGVSRWRNQSLATNKKVEGITEKQKAQEKGWWQLYDCGSSTWEYAVK